MDVIDNVLCLTVRTEGLEDRHFVIGVTEEQRCMLEKSVKTVAFEDHEITIELQLQMDNQVFNGAKCFNVHQDWENIIAHCVCVERMGEEDKGIELLTMTIKPRLNG